MRPHQVGILVSEPSERLLLSELLQEEGCHCWAPPSEIDMEDEASARMAETSLLIVQDSVAVRLGQKLLAQRDEMEHFFPIVLTLRGQSQASNWLADGYDDAIGMPMAQDELRARLRLTLRHQERSAKFLEAASQKMRVKESELQAARDEAEAARKTKAEFLANMSHELKTPLHGILGCVEILKEQHDSLDHLDMIEKSSLSLLGKLKELLDFASLDAGDDLLNLQVVETKKHLEAALQPLVERAASKGIELRVEFAGPLPEFSEIDAERLSQILANLIGNAIKFTKEGYITVVLTWLSNSLEIEVSDTGVGIPEDQQEAIFKPFVQVDSSTTRAYEGAGLGLAVVKKIMEALRGTISLESQLDKGSTFRAVLPMPASPAPSDGHLAEARSLRVLVVEDNPINSKVLSRLLTLWGHQPELATTGARGVEMASQVAYDIVIMDVHMPEMSGLEATRQIRSQEEARGASRVPIIALTARDREEDRALCLSSGMDEYFTKPPDYKKLRRVLQTLSAPDGA